MSCIFMIVVILNYYILTTLYNNYHFLAMRGGADPHTGQGTTWVQAMVCRRAKSRTIICLTMVDADGLEPPIT